MEENNNLNNDKILRGNNFFLVSNGKPRECKCNIKACQPCNSNRKPYTNESRDFFGRIKVQINR